jgi:RNA polymerase sigma factor (sigma-70 family)
VYIDQEERFVPSEQGSVTRLIFDLQKGDEYAATQLWKHFYERLIAAMRNRVVAAARRVSDEDDVVNSAFGLCFQAIREGKYPDLQDRHSLWGFLLSVSEKQLINLNRDQTRQKRGGGKTRGESVFMNPLNPERRGIEDLPGADPTPEFAAMVAEQSEWLLNQLDETQRRIATMKMAGYQNSEIAKLLDVSISTVERKLSLIRDVWRGIEQAK